MNVSKKAHTLAERFHSIAGFAGRKKGENPHYGTEVYIISTEINLQLKALLNVLQSPIVIRKQTVRSMRKLAFSFSFDGQ